MKQIMKAIGLVHRPTFRKDYLQPAITQGFVEPLYPNQPNHPRQKYRLTELGKTWLKENNDKNIN